MNNTLNSPFMLRPVQVNANSELEAANAFYISIFKINENHVQIVKVKARFENVLNQLNERNIDPKKQVKS